MANPFKFLTYPWFGNADIEDINVIEWSRMILKWLIYFNKNNSPYDRYTLIT